MQPLGTTTVCVLHQAWSFDSPPEPYVSVSGHIPMDKNSYAIEYTPWAEWLSMKVEIDPHLEAMADEEILAHIYWEMTWAGCDPDHVASQFESIKEMAEEAKALAGETKPH